MKTKLLLLASLLIVGCDATTDSSAQTRGFDPQQLALGGDIFKGNCQECHGEKAQGVTQNWQARQADGSLPAPPLNGTAHAWHHDDKTLLRTINTGGIPLGGTMPAFKDKLNQEEKLAVLTYIKSLWPEELYQSWKQRNG